MFDIIFLIGITPLLWTIISFFLIRNKKLKNKSSIKLEIDYRFFTGIKYGNTNIVLLPYNYLYNLQPGYEVILVSKVGAVVEKITKIVSKSKHYNNVDEYVETHGYSKLYPYTHKNLEECKGFYSRILIDDELLSQEILELTF